MPFSFQDITAIPIHVGIFLIALVLSIIATPFVRQSAIDAGYYDEPGGRKIHKAPIPRLGGIAIAIGFFAPLCLLLMFRDGWFSDISYKGIIIGAALMFFVGLVDDLYNLSPFIKLMGQILSVLAAFWMGVDIQTLDLPLSQLLILSSASLPISTVWLVGVTNSLNFIDGVDGLAGGVTVISAITFSVVAYSQHEPMAALMSLALAGSALGFLCFNFNPAAIFMGDGGALMCGFVLAAIGIVGVLKTLTMVLLVPVVILTVPLVDITYATFRRLIQLKSPFVADANHIHHKLLRVGLSQVGTVILLYVTCFLVGCIATIYVQRLYEYIIAVTSVSILSLILILIRRQYFQPDQARVNVSSPPTGS